MGLFSLIKKMWAAPLYPTSTRSKTEKPKVRRYDGARRGRTYADWFSNSNSANAEIFNDLTTLRNRSRNLLQNNDYGRGVITKLVDNVIFSGIHFQAQIKQVRNKKKTDNRANDKLEAAWKKWAENPKWCDAAGQLIFSDLQALGFKSLLSSGEVFIRKVNQSFDGSPVPFALEIIEADQCSEDHNQTYQGNQIVMGVEINKWRRPVAYWFYKEHPGDLWQGRGGVVARNLERVPASEIIHLKFIERPGQLRGVPLLYSTLTRLKNLGDYEEFEQIAAKAAACIMAVVTTPDADILGQPGKDGGEESLPADETLKSGIMRYLAPGEKFESFDPNRPNPNVVGYIESQLRASGAGIGASYESISNDYSKTNYSSSRLSLLQSRDRFRVMQKWFITYFCKEVYSCWLEQAVLGGALDFSDYEVRPERYQEIRWTPRGWSWVDPNKEVQAAIASIKSGLTTVSQEVAKQGGDFEENIKQIAREKEILEQYGVSLTFDDYAVHQDQQDQPQQGNSNNDPNAV